MPQSLLLQLPGLEKLQERLSSLATLFSSKIPLLLCPLLSIQGIGKNHSSRGDRGGHLLVVCDDGLSLSHGWASSCWIDQQLGRQRVKGISALFPCTSLTKTPLTNLLLACEWDRQVNGGSIGLSLALHINPGSLMSRPLWEMCLQAHAGFICMLDFWWVPSLCAIVRCQREGYE